MVVTAARFPFAVIALLVLSNTSSSILAQSRRPTIRGDGPSVRAERPPEEPEGPHHARKLLRETPLVRIHLGRPATVRQACTSTSADIVLVFKVGEDYRIEGNESYWRLIDEQVVPAVSAECGGMRHIKIGNYVDGYRLASASGGAPRVYRKDEPFMTKREQTGLSNLDGEAVEAPVNTATLTLTATGAPLRGFSLNDRDPTLPAPVSIAEARTEFVRYTQLVAQLDSERLDRQAQQRAASDEMRRWSYRHGQGFILTEELRRRQADAAEMVKDKGALLANAYAMAVETGLKLYQNKPLDPTGPLDTVTALLVVGIESRIREAEGVLATIPGWTCSRLQTSSALPASLSGDRFARDIFDGSFAGLLGEQPVSPVVPVISLTGQNDLTIASLAYQMAYGDSCKSARTSGWTVLPYDTDLVTTRGGLELRRETQKTTIYTVRDPFVTMFRADMVRWDSMSPLQYFALKSVHINKRDVFTAWFAAGGCQTDAARQFELNLFLAEVGFPPLQRLFQASPQ